MAEVMSLQRKRTHPHKFLLWVAIGSIIMMFAGLTSAYIVKRSQAGWIMLEIPTIFWYSTVTILLSSVAVHFAVKAFKDRNIPKYKQMVWITAVLGIAFLIMQIIGFMQFSRMDIRLVGAGSNASYSFLLAIAGLHAVHVLGGVIALTVIGIRAMSARSKSYNAVPVEVVATYWHFVDILWIYLILFFNWMK
ncbi:cytochrome c oxidase subunit 3 [Pollutibacter soli]|uniref:cytochrome c oxidase subunit 3 n=1 Tax=Pollutibacter soli TaxID=3034157 RepID=UPI0030138F72